ncbi:MAG TPA: cyclase family protein [Chloroflexia bacterium]|nr:cyclase family protein [Chloroflexia bacterium]
MTSYIDLSHVLEPGMPAYPGLPVPQFHTYFTHAESLERGTYAPGTSFQIATFEIPGNTGTYIDAPFHRYPEGQDFFTLPLEKMANLPATLATILREGPINPDDLAGLELKDRALLIRTDWSKHWGSAGYYRSGPFLTAESCQYLIDASVRLVGIDCANIDNMSDPSRPAHTALLAKGIPIVEHLCNLEQLPSGPFRFFAVPPAIKGGTSFPVRAFAIRE